MSTTMPRNFLLILLAVTLLATSGCHAKSQANRDFAKVAADASPAQAPAAVADADYAETPPAPVADPFYYWNKFWFGFTYLLQRPHAPLRQGLRPGRAVHGRTGLHNAYQNFIFPIRFVNALLQLNFTKASREFGGHAQFDPGHRRVMDVAKADPNLQPGNETSARRWLLGRGDGFYIVGPFLALLGPRHRGPGRRRRGQPALLDFRPLVHPGRGQPWYLSYVVKAGDVFNNLPDTLGPTTA